MEYLIKKIMIVLIIVVIIGLVVAGVSATGTMDIQSGYADSSITFIDWIAKLF